MTITTEYTFTATTSGGRSGAFVARITGVSVEYGFEREFLGREANIDYPGLFEIRSLDRRGNRESLYRVVIRVEALGGLRWCAVDRSAAAKIAKGLDIGRALDDCVRFVPNGGTLANGRPDFNCVIAD